MGLYQNLEKIVSASISISSERKLVLQPLINFIQEKVNKNENVLLNFICTHNSRRSHFSQIWAQTMAEHFQIPNVNCYSGGTETTEVYSMVIKTLIEQGFEIEKLSDQKNPIYSIKNGANNVPIIGFSKIYNDAFNPKSNFAAIMTCSHASENCPVVLGAENRFSLNYKDPKKFDNTPLQKEKYKERSLQIASEMHFMFSQIHVNS